MDVIISWPDSVDYPNWRSFIKKNRQRFNNVFVAFTVTNSGTDYTNFISSSMSDDNITFLYPPHNSPLTSSHFEDWRNRSVNQALDLSKSEWVWFTEQDFIIKDDDEFWLNIYSLMKEFDAIGYREGQGSGLDMSRYHPACLFVKRQIIDKTNRYFGIVPDVSDHFAVFSQQINLQNCKVSLLDKNNFTHMNGLSHNFNLMQRGEKIVYYPLDFQLYLKDCLLLNDVEINDDYKKIIIERYPDLMQ
jgi:hypothetical protein